MAEVVVRQGVVPWDIAPFKWFHYRWVQILVLFVVAMLAAVVLVTAAVTLSQSANNGTQLSALRSLVRAQECLPHENQPPVLCQALDDLTYLTNYVRRVQSQGQASQAVVGVLFVDLKNVQQCVQSKGTNCPGVMLPPSGS